MKTIFLLPPSEWKNNDHISDDTQEKLSFEFQKPLEIAISATEKDLKCTWERYKQWIQCNQNIEKAQVIPAIQRYSWVMYKAIDFSGMTPSWKAFFQANFLIFSGLYGIVKPSDHIANYKLPIETKWLYQFWWDKLAQALVDKNPDYIVNLLPIAYTKLIRNINNINNKNTWKPWTKIININFLKTDGKKIAHGVKKIKWERIKYICEKEITEYTQFGWEIVENWDIIDINLI